MIKTKVSSKLQFVVSIFMSLEIPYRKMHQLLWINRRVKSRIGETILRMLCILRCLIQFSPKISELRLKLWLKMHLKKTAEKKKMQVKISKMWNHSMGIAENWVRDTKIILLLQKIIIKRWTILYKLGHLYKIVFICLKHHLQTKNIISKKKMYQISFKITIRA